MFQRIIFLLLLAMGAVFILPSFVIAEGGEKKESKDEEEEEEKKGKKGGGEEKEGSKVEDSVFRAYLNVGDMIVPIVKREGVYAYLKLKVQIMTKDGSTIEPFRPYKKRLIDAYFTDVYSVMSDRWLPPKEPTKEAIEKRLSAQTNRIVGSDKLTTIITTFYYYKPEKKK